MGLGLMRSSRMKRRNPSLDETLEVSFISPKCGVYFLSFLLKRLFLSENHRIKYSFDNDVILSFGIPCARLQ